MEDKENDDKTRTTNENDLPLSSPVQKIDIEEGIEQSGSCGRYQILLQLLFTYLVLGIGCTAFLPYFLLDDPAWVCNSNSTRNVSNEFCHLGEHISPASQHFNKRCKMNSSEWSYSTTKDYSIVTEFDLICDKATYAAMANSMFFVGAIISAIVSGKCADSYGRKIVILALTSIIIICGISITFISRIWQLLALRGLYGLGLPMYNIGVIYLMEFVPSQRRALSGLLYQIPYSFSVLMLDAIGYLERRWRRVQLYAIIPVCLAYPALLFLPESPRWLLASGKTKRAEGVLSKIATCNGTTFTSTLQTPQTNGNNNETYSYLDLFRHKKVAYLTVVQSLLWLTSAMMYYAIGLESSKLGGDMYQVFAFSVLAEIPSSLMSLYFCNRLGRKKCVALTLCLSSLFTAGIAVIPRSYAEHHSTLNIIFALLAKFFVNTGYCSLYVWSFEINPTVVRSQGLLLFSVLEQVGGIVAPFLVGVLQNVKYILPFIVMAVICMVCCFLAWTLPETNNKPTREQYADFFEKEKETENANRDMGMDNEMVQTSSFA